MRLGRIRRFACDRTDDDAGRTAVPRTAGAFRIVVQHEHAVACSGGTVSRVAADPLDAMPARLEDRLQDLGGLWDSVDNHDLLTARHVALPSKPKPPFGQIADESSTGGREDSGVPAARQKEIRTGRERRAGRRQPPEMWKFRRYAASCHHSIGGSTSSPDAGQAKIGGPAKVLPVGTPAVIPNASCRWIASWYDSLKPAGASYGGVRQMRP